MFVFVRGFTGLDENIGPGIDEEGHTRLLRGSPHGCDPRTLVVGAVNSFTPNDLIFEVASDSPRFDELLHVRGNRFGGFAVASFEVDRYGQLDRGDNSLRVGDRQVEREIFAIVAPMRGRDRPASRRDRFRARVGDSASAARVPNVEENERIPFDMESGE